MKDQPVARVVMKDGSRYTKPADSAWWIPPGYTKEEWERLNPPGGGGVGHKEVTEGAGRSMSKLL